MKKLQNPHPNLAAPSRKHDTNVMLNVSMA
jgi:hypothetical protein